MKLQRILLLGAALAAAAVGRPQATSLSVEVSGLRSPEQIGQRVDASARALARNLAKMTEGTRRTLARSGRYDPNIPFSMPMVARLTVQGVAPRARMPWSRGGGTYGPTPITLTFDTAGPRVFPTVYRDLLQSVLDTARPTIDILFGSPSVGGAVRVRSYDADIGDRDAVAGGVFVPDNGFGEPEIRFPVYSNNEAAAVNFLHTLLLAYLGPSAYGYDAFQEGLVRAATMRVARSAGAMPAGLSPSQIAQVLENTYDVGSFYDWYNQRALGGPRFIAPNLVDVPLPAGGSLGGIYLLRYQMAGSAWQKVLVEYPSFAASFNTAFYLQPGLASDTPGLVALGQVVLDGLGGPGATVEGRSFASWFAHQRILETRLTYGPKLLVQPVPIASGLSGSDFGVFDVQATYFDTLASGDETLLSGTSFPIFWESSFNRVFPSSQEDRMDIAGAFGSVAPNFPNLFAGQPYRVAIDIPVQDRIARAYVPAGAVATASNPTPNDFYGTVVGLGLSGTGSGRVRLTYGATTVDTIPITNGAFGARINTPSYLGSQRLTVEVIRTEGGLDTTVLTRRVNKGPGELALDLRVGGDTVFAPAGGLPKGMSLLGFSADPLAGDPADVLGLAPSQVLAARYNASRAAYDLYPTLSSFREGHAFFVRLEAAQPGFSAAATTSPGTPTAVALRPGWNMIANPLPESTPTSRVRVVRSTGFPLTYLEGVGSVLGTDFFTFQPGAADPHSGAPETGTMVAATTFEPGKGYFVRVLAPEGASLLFTPQTPLAARSRTPDPLAAGPRRDAWLLGAAFDDGGQRSETLVGQKPGASRGFDPREDGGLPPGIGGFQAWVENSERTYRDIRPIGDAVYRIRLEGLRPNRTISLTFKQLEGRIDRLTVYDPVAHQRKGMLPSQTFRFRPRSTQQWIEISVAARDIR